MSQYWSPAVRELTPYVPGEQPREQVIKLNTNENPYPPAPGVSKALRNYATDHLRLYPDPTSHALRTALAESYGVSVAETFVGNGSDEVLAFLRFRLSSAMTHRWMSPQSPIASILFTPIFMASRFANTH